MSIYNSIAQLLRAGEDLVAAVIVSSSGSAPRAMGAKMAIHRDGSIDGTIGGGILEAKVQELAKEVFSRRSFLVKQFVLTNEDAGHLGMICGGQVEVLLHFINASQPSNLVLYEEATAAIESKKQFWLITVIPSGEDGAELAEQHLASDDGTHIGPLQSGLVDTLTAQAAKGMLKLIRHGRKRFLVESVCRAAVVYIFGAGHISQKLAPLTGLVGFRTVVVDDREEFANRERFDTADEIIVPDSFDRAFDGLDIDENSFVVLVTRGHAHDKTILGQALRTRAGYIGMIGSRRKRNVVYDALCSEGIPRQQFDRVCSPIGLDIGAETPEEIAVSIVAELIKARATGLKKRTED
jgi:xanthine dehydrogenase accessory factor